tara:strand:+ start:2926 stop:4551 length:1626 start_codon:yes stop_codon:yes gene_type:complete
MAALLLVVIAAVLRIWPLHLIESSNAWLTFYPAVMIAALYGGFFAGMLATVLACISIVFLWPIFLVQPFVINHFNYVEMTVFAISSIIISGLVESLHRANKRVNLAQQQAESAVLASAKSEQFINSIIHAMPNMIGYWDRDLSFRFANEAYQEWFGIRPQNIIGSSVRELMGEELYALNEPHILAALAGKQQSFHRRLTKSDGSVGYILGNYVPDIDEQGVVTGIFILAVDVTELKKAEAQLELAASVFESTSEGIAVTDDKGIILSVNPAFSEITGYSSEEAVGNTPRILKSNRHDRAFYDDMWLELANNGQWKGDIWNRRKCGEVFLERVTITLIRDPDGMPARYVSVFSDITDLWQKDEYLKHLAFHDALTNLPNRSLLMDRLNCRIATSEREQTSIALMFLDLDRFKFINDNFGHDVGDDLLKLVATRLLALVRESDTVSRLGGDEFVIKLTNPANKAEIVRIANRILAEINQPMEFRGDLFQVGVSIGIAVFPADGRSSLDLIKNADAAMYTAKDAGKNTFRFFEPCMVGHSERHT